MIQPSERVLNPGQQAALARLFSSSVVQEMARFGKSPLFRRLAMESAITNLLKRSDPVYRLFDAAFQLLCIKDYRHEYVYKAAITHKVLLGVHSLRTAAMLTEFRVGQCKADVAILNGTSTVYEIKSERDRLDRLQSQLTAYLQVFAKVNVITGCNHLAEISAIVPSHVGVLVLTDRFQIRTIREPSEDIGRIVPSVVFDSLQLHESRLILESLDVQVPRVPNTQLHQVLRERFSRLKPEQAHAGMVRVLRETRSRFPQASLIADLPLSIKSAALSTPLRQRDYVRLMNALKTPIQDALVWA